MKTINVTFEDGEYMALDQAKGDKNWREFILTVLEKKKDKKAGDQNTKTNDLFG